MSITFWWIAFIVIFVIVYAIDLYVTDHRNDEVSIKTSLRWAGTWIAIALIFGMLLYFFFPQNPDSQVTTSKLMGIKFISGYLTEYSLSVDNLFVFIMIFSMMGISASNQPKLLMLGIMISIVLRILFILVGMELVERFHWIIYIFGIILIWTAYKMAFTAEDDNVNPEANVLYKLASKIFPIDPNEHSPHFFTKIDGKRYITVMFLALLVIGSTDILFAVDSIPAIIGVIKEGMTGVLTLPEENFLAVSSNVFAVMGLISLFFALKGIMGMFRFLKHGVSFILLFIGLKMLLSFFHPVAEFFSAHSWISLAIIVFTLAFSVLLSMLISDEKKIEEEKAKIQELEKKLSDQPTHEDWETEELKKKLQQRK
ncbi:MAG: TerC/Alx family metal homeostasis membrane protein [Prevotellaceae bacterium]|jgi:tellurite resistance protein TerC|nr:TerC/Alx family metal homeostasis membrane protein [Prevotellaceae bacterium]